MARIRRRPTFILNANARKTSYQKRKAGIFKKINELTTLCGIEACAIIYSNIDHQQPEIWPSQLGAERVLAKFSVYPRVEQCKKMMNQETYLQKTINKAKDQFEKVNKDNNETLVSILMNQYLIEGKVSDNLTMVDVNGLGRVMDEKLNQIHYRLSALDKNLASTSKIQSK